MNIRIVRTKIKSVTNVKKITQAMQMVSAIKMKKTQQIATEGQPYQEFLERSITRFIRKLDPKLSRLLVEKEGGKDLNILITSNKGLCGAFNVNLMRFLVQKKSLRGADIVSLGKKGAVLARSLGANVLADFSANNPQESVSALFNYVLEQFLSGNFNRIYLYHNKFISSLRYEPTEEQLIPVKQFENKNEEKEPEKEYLVEPSPESIVRSLLREYIEERIRFAVIESEAGEHSARMIAMKNATDNANDVIYNLTLLRNQLRQQKITYELLDMITAKESVEVS